MDDQNDKELLGKVSDAIEQKAITFDIDALEYGLFGKKTVKKKSFTIKPLTAAQLHKISTLVLSIDMADLSANGVFNILKDQLMIACKVVAVAVTDSRKEPSKKLIDTFYHNLDHNDLETALKIVFQQMEVVNFISTMASIRNLSVLERKTAGVQSAGKKEASPQVPGNLSAIA